MINNKWLQKHKEDIAFICGLSSIGAKAAIANASSRWDKGHEFIFG